MTSAVAAPADDGGPGWTPNPFQFAASLFEAGIAAHGSTWIPYPHQVPPAGDWLYWILMAGRGAGKTDAGAHFVNRHASGPPCFSGGGGHRIAIGAPTLGDAASICVNGVSGLLAHNPAISFAPGSKKRAELLWPNGAQGTLFGAYAPEDVERWRGPQHCLVWAEELAAWRYLDECWSNMRFGLRLGARPRVIATTTPKPRAKLRALLGDPRTVVSRATTDDNPHLDAEVRKELYRLYGGTRLGRQELEAELLEDVPGALWKRAQIDEQRVTGHPDLVRVVVAVDPEATSGEDSAETGIITVGTGWVEAHPVIPELVEAHPPSRHLHGYVIADDSVRGTPREWGTAAVTAYRTRRADRVVGEVNNGGEMIEFVLRTIDKNLPYRSVYASRGKATRAEPISSLYEQGLIHHVGTFPELEDQLCTWVPGESARSPDRLDALVWGFTELVIGSIEVADEDESPMPTISPV
jgi:phage terminase large subunit-like protein